MKNLSFKAIVAAALVLPGLAFAESQTINPAAANSAASAKLDFTVVIPAVLYLRVGAGNIMGATDLGTVNGLTFTASANSIGDSVPVAAAVGDGDLGNGAVTVRVFSNFGTNVSLNSSVTGQLSNANGDTIPWSQITVVDAPDPTAIPGFTNAGITHPAFSATSGNGTATTLTAASKLVRQQGKWTFSYANTNVVPAGTYGGTVARHGQVIYTATQL